MGKVRTRELVGCNQVCSPALFESIMLPFDHTAILVWCVSHGGVDLVAAQDAPVEDSMVAVDL